jgi:hypothetical protein
LSLGFQPLPVKADNPDKHLVKSGQKVDTNARPRPVMTSNCISAKSDKKQRTWMNCPPDSTFEGFPFLADLRLKAANRGKFQSTIGDLHWMIQVDKTKE